MDRQLFRPLHRGTTGMDIVSQDPIGQGISNYLAYDKELADRSYKQKELEFRIWQVNQQMENSNKERQAAMERVNAQQAGETERAQMGITSREGMQEKEMLPGDLANQMTGKNIFDPTQRYSPHAVTPIATQQEHHRGNMAEIAARIQGEKDLENLRINSGKYGTTESYGYIPGTNQLFNKQTGDVKTIEGMKVPRDVQQESLDFSRASAAAHQLAQEDQRKVENARISLSQLAKENDGTLPYKDVVENPVIGRLYLEAMEANGGTPIYPIGPDRRGLFGMIGGADPQMSAAFQKLMKEAQVRGTQRRQQNEQLRKDMIQKATPPATNTGGSTIQKGSVTPNNSLGGKVVREYQGKKILVDPSTGDYTVVQ